MKFEKVWRKTNPYQLILWNLYHNNLSSNCSFLCHNYERILVTVYLQWNKKNLIYFNNSGKVFLLLKIVQFIWENNFLINYWVVVWVFKKINFTFFHLSLVKLHLRGVAIYRWLKYLMKIFWLVVVVFVTSKRDKVNTKVSQKKKKLKWERKDWKWEKERFILDKAKIQGICNSLGNNQRAEHGPFLNIVLTSEFVFVCEWTFNAFNQQSKKKMLLLWFFHMLLLPSCYVDTHKTPTHELTSLINASKAIFH